LVRFPFAVFAPLRLGETQAKETSFSPRRKGAKARRREDRNEKEFNSGTLFYFSLYVVGGEMFKTMTGKSFGVFLFAATNSGRLLAFTAVIILVLVSGCAAQDDMSAKVDEYIKAEMQKQRIPGLSLAVIKDGQILHAKGYGFANVEHQVPVKPETIFQSGSVGKQFTATALMILVEEGKINLDDKINKYLKIAPERWKDVTVRHLLTHTAGMIMYPKNLNLRQDYTEDELLKHGAEIPLAFQPGEKFQYSNLGYFVLGIMISKLTGEFYGDFMQERIFKKLGMNTARVISEADIIPNRAAGYRLEGGELKNQEWVSPTLNSTADGSLYLTVLDMAKWDAALYGEKILKKSSLDQMWTAVRLNNGETYPYGFGWFLSEVRGHRIIEHAGGWQGFNTYIARYVNDKLTVVVLANLNRVNNKKIVSDVAGIYNAELAPPPIVAIADKEPKITALVKELIQKFTEGTADPNIFTSEIRAEIFPDHVRKASMTLKSFGALGLVELIERKDEDGDRIYRYRLEFKEKIVFCALRLTKEAKIAGFQLSPE
jgi:D-alanyl-D-alanine carboxypeptidase